MIGTIIAIAITVIFFRSALSAEKKPVNMAVAGFLAFFIPALMWTYFIAPGIKDALQHDPSSMLLKVSANYAYILMGSICAGWVWRQNFKD